MINSNGELNNALPCFLHYAQIQSISDKSVNTLEKSRDVVVARNAAATQNPLSYSHGLHIIQPAQSTNRFKTFGII
jgi:hypothetical protein